MDSDKMVLTLDRTAMKTIVPVLVQEKVITCTTLSLTFKCIHQAALALCHALIYSSIQYDQ